MASKYVPATHEVRATYTDAAGTLYDPDTVVMTVVDPAGTVTNPTPANPSVGVYDFDFQLDLAGIWFYDVVATGPDGAVVVSRANVCALAPLVEAAS